MTCSGCRFGGENQLKAGHAPELDTECRQTHGPGHSWTALFECETQASGMDVNRYYGHINMRGSVRSVSVYCQITQLRICRPEHGTFRTAALSPLFLVFLLYLQDHVIVESKSQHPAKPTIDFLKIYISIFFLDMKMEKYYIISQILLFISI